MEIEEPISLDVLRDGSALEIVAITGFDNVVKHSRRAAGDSFVKHPILNRTCAEIPSEYFSDPEKNAKLVIIEGEMKRMQSIMLEKVKRKTTKPRGGCALAAIQLGVDARVFMARCPECQSDIQYYDEIFSDAGSKKSVHQFMEEGYSCYLEDFTFFYNPTVVDRVEDCKVACSEGCFSLPGFRISRETPVACTVKYQNVRGEKCFTKLFGWPAWCAMHEVGHMSGVLMTDRLTIHEIRSFMEQWEYKL